MSVRRLFWDAPADFDLAGHKVYRAVSGEDLFAAIKNGTAIEVADIPLDDPNPNQYLFDDEDVVPGDYQFAVTAYDETGNESDPYQHPGWAVVNVAEPIDTTPPSPPSGGGIELVS